MDQVVPQANPAAGKNQRMDFVPTKSETKMPAVNSATPVTPEAPTPVTSAKAAINAMYAQRNAQPKTAQLVPSARAAVNAAASQAQKSSKSAANLHHGSIQRSMESTRTSASALLKSKSDHDGGNVPVVHTSLKLGANARPKQAPVVLPPNARMARVARPVEPESDGNLVVHRQPATKKLPQSSDSNDGPLKVQILPASSNPKVKRPALSGMKDPQMLPSGRRQMPVKSAQAKSLSSNLPAQKSAVARPTTSPSHTERESLPAKPRRFRPMLKPFGSAKVTGAASEYALTKPPKMSTHQNLGVVGNYRAPRTPKILGDTASIGRLMERHVASGHGQAAQPAIKTENTSNYSFSRKAKAEPKMAPYAPNGESPFLKSVSVEKRPLSDNSAVHAASETYASDAKPSRKNQYAKKTAKAAERRADLPARPTVIIPSSRRSKAPLFFLILLTIILGATVGAAVYLCFFQ